MLVAGARTNPELSLMPVRHMPLVGIPTCLRKANQRLFHGVDERYPSAVIDAARCSPVLIPAIGSKVDVCAVLDRLDGLLLTGSPSNVHPSHYGVEPSDPKLYTIRSATQRRWRDP